MAAPKLHLERPDDGAPLCNTAGAQWFTFKVETVTCKRCAAALANNQLWYMAKLERFGVPLDFLQRLLENYVTVEVRNDILSDIHARTVREHTLDNKAVM